MTRSFVVMEAFGSDFEAFQREAEARTFGAELFQQAAAISPEAVEAVSAVLLAVMRKTRGQLPVEIASEYAWQMMAERAVGHYETLHPQLPLDPVDGESGS